MRLHFSLSPNKEPVPYNYPHFLTGRFQSWIDKNDLHDALSLYSLGWLQGGGARGNALHFPRGAQWFISAPDTPEGTQLLEIIAGAALQHPQVCCGMEVTEIYSENTPEFGSSRLFKANSPIFIRGDKDPHILFSDPRADQYLTKTLRHKLDKAGLGQLSESAKVSFDKSYRNPKTRLIHVKADFYKRANVCPVVVEGEPEAVRFAWCVGAGNLTGSGFGSLI
jgi:CRISPR-associated endoribonuclease Cas6